jgi:hypothetical protein
VQIRDLDLVIVRMHQNMVQQVFVVDYHVVRVGTVAAAAVRQVAAPPLEEPLQVEQPLAEVG